MCDLILYLKYTLKNKLLRIFESRIVNELLLYSKTMEEFKSSSAQICDGKS